jgi:hypothetical protein
MFCSAIVSLPLSAFRLAFPIYFPAKNTWLRAPVAPKLPVCFLVPLIGIGTRCRAGQKDAADQTKTRAVLKMLHLDQASMK